MKSAEMSRGGMEDRHIAGHLCARIQREEAGGGQEDAGEAGKGIDIYDDSINKQPWQKEQIIIS